MTKHYLCFLTLVLVGIASRAHAAEALPAKQLAARIDALILAKRGADCAPADDATIHRRLMLDLLGRIPTVAESRDYLGNDSPEKQDRLISTLLQSPGHARHAARMWRRIWIPRSETPAYRSRAVAFDEWLATRFRNEARYDDVVRTLLTATPAPALDQSEAARQRSSPALFLAASEYEPEQLAANSHRAFLGLNLDCAQCHNHPFARWTQEQFWQTASFFARPPASEETGRSAQQSYRLTITGTDRQVTPRFLDGDEPTWPADTDHRTGRQLLANWITSPGNPYFATNAVNRLWGQFFPWGLIEPFDDLSGAVAAEHPEVLRELTQNFVASNFDQRYLIEVLVRTQAYRSVTTSTASAAANRSALRLDVRGLSGEQLYDSLHVAAGYPVDRFDLEPLRAQWEQRELFIRHFQRGEATPSDRSVSQTLALMNGQLTESLTDSKQSPLLASLSAPFLTADQRVEILYLATLSRYPTAAEQRYCLQAVSQADEAGPAWSDLLWALLNCHEFNTNH